jgi:hypothetical protein
MRYTTRRRPSHAILVSNLLGLSSWASVAAAQDTAGNPAPAPVADPPPTRTAVATPAPVQGDPFFDVKLDIGLGLRSELVFDPDRDPPEDSPVYTVINDLRPYIAGQVNDYIKFEGNLDSDGNNIRVLDALLKFEFNDYFNLWLGHFLPPSDRANLSGPYFQNAWRYPSGVHAYTNEFAGRDDGLAAWGQINGGQFKYQLGFFGMRAGDDGTPDPRFAARVVYNVLDPEPGYYNSSTYFGTKDILAIGAVFQYEPAPEGAPEEAANALWNLDALYENSFGGGGTLDIEAAFYGFGGADQGTSFFLLGSFLFEQKVGWGQFQPMLRVQRAEWSDGDTFQGITAPADEDASIVTVDAGIHYIINGHNARLAATIQHTDFNVPGPDSNDTVFILGGQIQAF